MKRPILALALAACVLMTISGCGVAGQPSPTPSGSMTQEDEVTSPLPTPTPEGGSDDGMNAEQGALPSESQPATGDSTETPPGEENPTETAPQPSQAPSAGAGAPTQTPPSSGAVTPPSKVPQSSQPPRVPPAENVVKPPVSTIAPEQKTAEISKIERLERGFSSASFSGNDSFEDFLAEGGASSDAEVTAFLAQHLLADVALNGNPFGCSTIAVKSPTGDTLFGRNFDWQACDALVVTARPEGAYASISTVNMDFISQGDDGSLSSVLGENDVRVMAALYAPLDGMNEKGLAVSVNMIEDSASISQNTENPDITTTTAIRLLLNKAASVSEALELLRQYDMHASMGMMVHFALADTTGRSVVVEYVSHQMIVTDTSVVTNFYLSDGPKNGIGSQQSHTRYDILMEALAQQQTMDMDDVRDALNSVSKDNFNEFESTEWSAVFNLSTGQAQYYHRENYTPPYSFSIN